MGNKVITDKIKWLSLENIDATRSLKQHAFVPRQCKEKWTGDLYNGNTSLCRKIWASDDGEYASDWDELDSEPLNESNACKKCLSIANKIKS